MAFSEQERATIRRWMGAPGTFLIGWPNLENAITLIQSVADGGGRPDNSSEVLVRGYITQLSTIETNIQNLYVSAFASEVDGDVKVDFARGTASLRQVGRQYVGHIADVLNFTPLRDVFSPRAPVPR